MRRKLWKAAALAVCAGLMWTVATADGTGHSNRHDNFQLPEVQAKIVSGDGLEPTLTVMGQSALGQSSSRQTEVDGTADAAAESRPLAAGALLDVPIISQNPELYNGCEVTSLSMLLEAANHPVDKVELADQVKKDPSPMEMDDDGNIVAWGNPNTGFVGSITGDYEGYGVYHGPIAALLDSVLPGQASDLSGGPFERVLETVSDGRPVVVWTNDHFSVEDAEGWMTWQSDNGPVKASWHEHAVLLVGFDADSVYLNDPLDGTKAKPVPREDFIASWEQMGRQAVTFRNHEAG